MYESEGFSPLKGLPVDFLTLDWEVYIKTFVPWIIFLTMYHPWVIFEQLAYLLGTKHYHYIWFDDDNRCLYTTGTRH